MSSPSAPAFAVSAETLLLLAFSYAIGILMLMTAGLYDGPLAEPALGLAFGGLVLLLVLFARLLAGKSKPSIPFGARAWLLVMLAALVFGLVASFVDRRLLIDGTIPPRSPIRVVQCLSAPLLGSYVPGLQFGTHDSPRWRNARFALLAVFLVVAGANVFALSPHPRIDTWKVQQAGAAALLHGQNPYVDVHVQETDGMRSVIALVYPPTACYLNAIANALGGDVRWGLLAALLVIGVSARVLCRINEVPAGSIRPAFLEDAPALFLWLSPKTLFYLEQGWNDVYPLALVALSLVAHAYRRRLACAVMLGLALSAKQTMVWFVPLAVLLEFDRRQWAAFLGTAAATVAPFILADFAAFKHWLFDFYVQYTPRHDALSLSNFFQRHLGTTPHSSPGLFLAALCTALALWRAPRTRYAFALSATLALYAFFLFNIWMFINAYFFCAGFSVIAAAADAASSGSKTRTSSPVLA